MARLIIIIGIILILVGLFWPQISGTVNQFGGKFGFGRLPGDISLEGERSKFFFPIVSCLILSAVISLLFWFIQK